MRRFYENVDVDFESLRFYAGCPICGRKNYGGRIPLSFRDARKLDRCRHGRAGRLSQMVFNRIKASSVQLLAVHFNQCEKCRRFVCDDCFDSGEGICAECKNK